MRRVIHLLWSLALAASVWLAAPARAQEQATSNLVTVAWLQSQLGRDDVVVLDASFAHLHAAGHIPGAISADLYSLGVRELPLAAMERRFQGWGLSPGKKVVIVDQGADMMSTRLFFDLVYRGVPASSLFILDGGMAQWRARGGAVTKDPTPAPARGTLRLTQVNDELRVRLPEFLNASGDPARHTLVEALDPEYHFGERKFFNRGGHVPFARMLPAADFYNADKTFKSPAEIRRMVQHLGVRPEQVIHSYCGGGVAATVPFFALKFMLGFPQVKLYVESQNEYLQDERELPFWTYSAPYLKRDAEWLAGWNARMLRAFGLSTISIVDVRSPEAYRLGHVPFAVNVSAETFRAQLNDPGAMATSLGPAGINPAHEAVIVSDGGITPGAALAFVMLERLGQHKVSVLMDSVDEWGLRGHTLAKEPTLVGAPKGPQDLAVAPAVYAPAARPGVMVQAAAAIAAASGQFPRVYVESGAAMSAASRAAPGVAGQRVHLPYTALLNADRTPKAAKDLWNIISKAGVSRYAELVLVADDPADAAVNYVVFRMMGFTDIKMQLPG